MLHDLHHEHGQNGGRGHACMHACKETLSMAEFYEVFAGAERRHLHPERFNILRRLICEAIKLQNVVQEFRRRHGCAKTRDEPAA